MKMKTLNNFKIGTKLILSATFFVVMATTAMSISISLIVQKMTEDHLREIVTETAYHYADMVRRELESTLVSARTLASVFESVVNTQKGQLSREQANLMLKYFIEQHPQFLGVSLRFESNAFDGKDNEFVDPTGQEATGRFLAYWTRNEHNDGVLEPFLNDGEEGIEDWYQLPKKYKKEYLVEPYLYSLQGRNVLMTTLAVPLLDKQEEFLGVVGIDIALEELQQQVSHIKIADFKEAYINFYSSTGIVVAHENPSNIGKSIDETNNNKEFIGFVLDNKAFFMKRESKVLAKPVVTYGTPVEIGNTDTPWMVVVNIPEEELRTGLKQVIGWTIILGIGVIFVTILTLYPLTKKLLIPLVKVTQHLKILSQGQISEEEITYQGTDEIAEIVGSFKQLKRGMKNTIQQANAIATGHYHMEMKLLSDKDQLGQALVHMTKTLREITARNVQQDWLKTGQMQLNDQMRGEQKIIQLSENIINFITPYVEAQVGALYLLMGDHLNMVATYAYTWRKHLLNEFKIGEGIVGQVALERKMFIITYPPEDYIYIQTGLGESRPKTILAIPFLYEDTLKGVVELASLKEFTGVQIEFLNQVMPSIGVVVHTAESRAQMQELLKQIREGQ